MKSNLDKSVKENIENLEMWKGRDWILIKKINMKAD